MKSKNFHPNYHDYDVERRELAAEQERLRRERLLARWQAVYEEVREYNEFMERVKDGKRPTFGELKYLSKMKFAGYANLIIAEHSET